jgi:hypothetical protein
VVNGVFEEMEPTAPEDREMVDKAWGKIFELANVPATGPNNRQERRRVEKVLARLKKRGLTVS